MEQQVLEDEEIINYLIKNEDIIQKCFHVPDNESPSKYLLELAYDSNKKALSSKIYSTVSLYVTKRTECSFCNKK